MTSISTSQLRSERPAPSSDRGPRLAIGTSRQRALDPIDGGPLALVRVRTELRDLIEQTVGEIDPRVVIEARGRILIHIDDVRIQRVVLHFVHTALASTPIDAPVIVRLEHDREAACISVIEPADASSAPYADEASALELYMCCRIIEAHGGRIGVERLADGATRFYVLIPTVA